MVERSASDINSWAFDPATLHEGRSPSVLPGRRASMYPGGLPPGASREAGPTTPQDTPSPAIPKAPRVPDVSSGFSDEDDE